MDERLERFVRDRLRRAGQQYERTRRAYTSGKNERSTADDDRDTDGERTDSAPTVDAPTDESGRVKLVCRRYAEKRAVDLDSENRPACFEADHPDCVGCVEDLHDGRIETW